MILDAERIEELRRDLEGFTRSALKRGRAYFGEGRVTEVKVSKAKISGLVLGTDWYDVEWKYRSGFWTCLCSCPVGVDCKHAAALAYAAIVGDSIPEAAAENAHAPKRPANPILEEAEGRLGRKLSTDERNMLRAVSDIYRQVVSRGQQFLGSFQLTSIGLPLSTLPLRWDENKEMDGWWDEPPETMADFIDYLVLYLRLGGHPIPEVLGGMGDGEKFRSDVETRRHNAEVAAWKQRLDQLDMKSAKTPPPIRLRLANTIVWEEEYPTGTWRKVSAERVRERAARAHESDEATAILLDLARHGGIYGFRSNYSLKLSRSDDALFINRALNRFTTRSRIVRADGEPLSFPDEPLRWKVAPDPADPERWLVASLALPSGAVAEGYVLVEAGSSPLAISPAGEVRRLPRPIEGASCQPTRIPKAALSAAPRAIQALRDSGAILPEELSKSIVTVALSPCLVCELVREQGGAGEQVHCMALAVSNDPFCEMVWRGSEGWRPRGKNASPTSGSTGPIPVPDPGAADDLVARLSSLSSNFLGYAGKWVLSIGRKFAEEFGQWARSLPEGIEIRASPELRAFFEPSASSASLDFQIEERSDAPDWFDVRASLRNSDIELSSEEILVLLKARGGFVRLKSGAWARMEMRFDNKDIAALDALGLTLDSIVGGEKHGFHALQLAGEHGARLAGAEVHSRIAKRAAELRAIEPPPQPAELAGALRPYQMEGFHFLAFLSVNRLGGILADDMGLGKTIQTLAWLLWLRSRGDAAAPFRVLVVCPKSVVHNWCSEAARFAPSLRCGPFSASGDGGIVVANYAQLRLQADWFSNRAWDAVILDEGQNIKNPASQTARIARELPAAHRLILTGTPIENRPLDLWSLFSFAQPGLLGSQSGFKRLFESEAGSGDGLVRLHSRVRHFLLRRTKAQVAPELPSRTEEEIVCDLAGEQAELYQAELKEARRLILGLESQADFDKARFHVLQRLLRLRQICCDPRLLAGGTGPAIPSAKMEALLDQLRPLVDGGHKILVFSQFVEMLGHISGALAREGIAHLMLTGKTDNRQQMVEKFQSDAEISVFLLSLKAAGAGLNLTAASYVILYDPWWNPAVEAQAIDRTHRIGQEKPVIAYRLLAAGTIEEKIRALQKQKAAIADAVVREESLGSVLDIESIRFLLAET